MFSIVPQNRHDLQLLGCACMLIAAKYEEMYAPAVDEFVFISDETYSRESILSMECRVLRALKFNLTVYTVPSFLPRFQRASIEGNPVRISSNSQYGMVHIANYLSELALQKYDLLQYKPSLIASSLTLIARLINRTQPLWHTTLRVVTTYELSDMKYCAIDIMRLVEGARASNLHAIRRKYMQSEFGRVSTLNIPVSRICQIILNECA